MRLFDGHRSPRAGFSLVAALLVLCVSGCGKGAALSSSSNPASTDSSATSQRAALSHTTITTRAIPKGQRLRGDGDADNPGDIDGNGDVDSMSPGGQDGDQDSPTAGSYLFPDSDDRATFAYGRRATGADARAIATVLKRYYAAASRGNGVEVCSLLPPSFVDSVVNAYGESNAPEYLRGAKSCPELAAKFFRHARTEVAEPVTVVSIRVDGENAQAIYSSRKMPASHILLARLGSSWKVQQLTGAPLP